jgi:hypothetical protein
LDEVAGRLNPTEIDEAGFDQEDQERGISVLMIEQFSGYDVHLQPHRSIRLRQEDR